MKLKLISHAAIAGWVVASGTAWAAGTHAGGHGPDEAVIGKPGVAANATRTVQIDMSDAMRFTPSKLKVKQGETVRFVVRNSGQIKHEMVLGTDKDLAEHYEVMKKNPEMEHADENMVTVAPGKTGEVVWQFTQAGNVSFACLQPGHYDAGMKGAVRVSKVAGAKDAQSPGHAGAMPLAAPMAANKAGQIEAPVRVAQAARPAGDMSEGEVRKVDKENNKITLKHGEIKSLEMPGMTMVFQVKDAAMLDTVKVGDKVRFTAEKAGGSLVVTTIELAK